MFERLRNVIGRKALAEPRHPSSGGGPWWWYTPTTATDRDMRRAVGDGLGSSVIMAPVQWIARAWPAAPLMVTEPKGDERKPVIDHELLELLGKPNPYYSGTVLWMASLVDFCITGNAYWLKVRNRGGVGDPVQLWWAPKYTMCPKAPLDPKSEVFVDHYEYNYGGGEPLRLPPSDVVHLRYGMNPNNPREGLSPIHSALAEVFTDDEAARLSATVLGNLGIPGIVFTPKGEATPSPDEVTTMKEYLKAKFTGAHRGDPLVIGAPTDVTVLPFKANELDLSGLRDISEERVCALLGVPAAIVGFGAGLQQTKVGATMRELRAAAWEDCIIPMERLVAEQLDGQILPDFEPEMTTRRCEFDTSQIKALSEDETAMRERDTRSLLAGALLVSDYQRRNGLPVDETQNVYLRPLGVIEVPEAESFESREEREAESNPIPPALAAANGNGKPPADDDDPELPKHLKGATRQQARVVAMFDRDARRMAGAFEGDLKDVFKEIGEQVGDAAVRLFKANGNGHVTKAEPEDPSITDIDAAHALTNAVEWPKITDAYRGTYQRQYLRVFEKTLRGLIDTIGLTLELADPLARQILEQGGKRAGLVDLKKQTRARIFEELAEAREAGENPLSIARRLREMVPAGPWSTPAIRAEVIARTETKFAQRESALAAYEAATNVSAVMVFDARLGDSDPECMERNGRVVTFEEARQMDDHPNGTLDFAPVVE